MFIECYVLGTVLSSGDIAVDKTDKNFFCREAYIWEGVLNKSGSVSVGAVQSGEKSQRWKGQWFRTMDSRQIWLYILVMGYLLTLCSLAGYLTSRTSVSSSVNGDNNRA